MRHHTHYTSLAQELAEYCAEYGTIEEAWEAMARAHLDSIDCRDWLWRACADDIDIDADDLCDAVRREAKDADSPEALTVAIGRAVERELDDLVRAVDEWASEEKAYEETLDSMRFGPI